MKFLNIICRLKEYFLDFYFTKKLWSIDSAKMTNYIYIYIFFFSRKSVQTVNYNSKQN